MPNKFTVSTGAVLLASGIATATPINITSQLTGDVRQASGENPTNLIVDVTITSDTTSNTASWVVDINSPLHPDIKLDEFYFNLNLTGLVGGYSFGNFNPTNWTVQDPNAGTQGAGGVTPDFLFAALDPPPGPPQNVTNSVSLMFDMILDSDTFDESFFLTAATSVGNDSGQGQLGAHLQSLTDSGTDNCPNGCNTDSGFAFGNYSSSSSSSSGGTASNTVPEPGTVSLLGIAMLGGLVMWRRRRIDGA